MIRSVRGALVAALVTGLVVAAFLIGNYRGRAHEPFADATVAPRSIAASPHPTAGVATPVGAPSPRSLNENEAILNERVDAQNRLLDVLLFLAAGLAALGALYQFVSPVERRAREAAAWMHERQDWARQSFQIALDADETTRRQDADLFKNSLQTVQLVNATLTLARDASERASDTLKRESEENLERLEHDAAQIVLSAAKDDDRDIVRSSKLRTRLRANAKQVGNLQGSLRLLRIRLAPHAEFLLGMNSHLNGDFEDALHWWQEVTVHPAATPELKSKVWYWIGYERNNIHEFEDAVKAFEQAQEGSSDVRAFELRRILLESHFFGRRDTEEIAQSLEDLLNDDRLATGLDTASVVARILTTLGNVWFAHGKEQATVGVDGNASLLNALSYFDQALALSRSGKKEMWPLFGRAECLTALQRREEAAALFLEVQPLVEEEFRTREELRTRVLARSSEFICALGVPDPDPASVESLYLRTTDMAVDVREPLTIYSQVQKRNVTRAEFLSDMDSLWDTFKERTI